MWRLASQCALNMRIKFLLFAVIKQRLIQWRKTEASFCFYNIRRDVDVDTIRYGIFKCIQKLTGRLAPAWSSARQQKRYDISDRLFLESDRPRITTDEKRVLRGRWTETRLWRYGGSVLGSCENFIGKWEELVFNAFSDFEPVERA